MATKNRLNHESVVQPARDLGFNDDAIEVLTSRIVDQRIPASVALYRALTPESRATDHTTWYGSSSCVRRATCVYCGQIAATSSGKWRETQRSISARIEHGAECSARFVSGLRRNAARRRAKLRSAAELAGSQNPAP